MHGICAWKVCLEVHELYSTTIHREENMWACARRGGAGAHLVSLVPCPLVVSTHMHVLFCVAVRPASSALARHEHGLLHVNALRAVNQLHRVCFVHLVLLPASQHGQEAAAGHARQCLRGGHRQRAQVGWG